MPKVSVIVPVYNKGPYLRKCLDSIVGQTLKDIEILCIDDCSTDLSLQIVQEYARKDPRIKVFRNSENRGLSATRNVGIDNACGEYVQFTDADDCLELDTFEVLYRIAVDNQLDLLKFLTTSQGKVFNVATENRVFSGPDMLNRIICQPYCGIGPCFLFINRYFIEQKHIRFVPRVRYGEDVLFTFQVMNAAERCMCVNKHKYRYIRAENSLGTSPLTDEKIFARLYVIKEILTSDSIVCDDKLTKLAYLVFCYETLKEELEGRLEVPDVSQWNPDSQRMYQIFFSGQGWLENLIDREKLSIHKDTILNAGRLYIFGAGKAARRLIQILYQAGVEIAGVIVSDKTKNRKTVYGYQVFSVDEVSADGQPLILSAVKGAYDEIYALLEAHEFYNVLNVCL